MHYKGHHSLQLHFLNYSVISFKNHDVMSDTGNYSEKRKSELNLFDPLITSSDALALCYRRLMGAKAIKLGSWFMFFASSTTS